MKMQSRSTLLKSRLEQKYTRPTTRRSPVMPKKLEVASLRIVKLLLNRAARTVHLRGLLPVRDFGFNLHKQAFRDALCHTTLLTITEDTSNRFQCVPSFPMLETVGKCY